MNIDDFSKFNDLNRENIEAHKRVLRQHISDTELDWAGLAFAWTPTRTTEGWVWLRRVWRIRQVDGRTRYEIARSK